MRELTIPFPVLAHNTVERDNAGIFFCVGYDRDNCSRLLGGGKSCIKIKGSKTLKINEYILQKSWQK